MTTRHYIPRVNWHMKLAESIEKAESGDTIVCHDEDMREMGQRARTRMCPGKELTFDLETERESQRRLVREPLKSK